MSQELFYTSAPSGIKPGSKGFCTVAMTAGMSAMLVQRLEMLSSYRELFAPTDPRAALNPPAYWYLRLSIGAQSFALLSRIAFAGADYSQRANIFAHHVVIDSSEQSPGGPACTLSQPGFMDTQWTGSPRLIPTGRPVPRVDDPPRVCSAWEAATGDSGWAGVLAETAAADPGKVAYVIYSPETPTLPLIREAMALLPQRKRWQTTFCSYFTELPAGCTCAWRFCIAGTAAAKEAARYASSGVIINLTGNLGNAPESAMVQTARTGEMLEEAPRRPMAAPVLVAVGAEIEPAPREVQPRRSLSEKPTIANQNWMPPINATLIQSEDDHSLGEIAHSPRSRAVFWLIALIWPLFVVVAVVAWHFNAQSRIDFLVNQAKADAQKQQEEKIKEADQRYATLNDKVVELQGEIKEIPSLKQAKADAENKRDKATAKSQELSSDLNASDAASKLKDAKIDELQSQLLEQKSRYDRLADELTPNDNWVAPPIDVFTKGDRLLWKPINDGDIQPNRIQLVANKVDAIVPQQKSDSDIEISLSGAGPDGLSLLLTNGCLFLRSGDGFLENDQLKAWLQTSYVSVFEKDKRLVRVRLYPEQSAKLNLNEDSRPVILSSLALNNLDRLSMRITTNELGNGWMTVWDSKNHWLILKKPAQISGDDGKPISSDKANFHIELEGDLTTHASWLTARDELKREFKEKEDKYGSEQGEERAAEDNYQKAQNDAMNNSTDEAKRRRVSETEAIWNNEKRNLEAARREKDNAQKILDAMNSIATTKQFDIEVVSEFDASQTSEPLVMSIIHVIPPAPATTEP
jgi:hypothetical protein